MIKLNKIFLMLIILSTFLPLANAQQNILSTVSQVSQSTVNSAVSVFGPIFKAIIGEYNDSEFLFAKFLLLLILFVIINTILKRVPFFENQKGVVLIIAIAVSVLSVRFISQNQLVSGILLPYGTLGVALTTILPFLIFFYFVHQTGMVGLGRRLSWFFFGAAFLVLWLSRSNEISSDLNWIYAITLAAIVLAILFDSSIHHYFAFHQISVFKRKANTRTIAGLQAEYLQILNVDTSAARTRRADIERQLRDLGGSLP